MAQKYSLIDHIEMSYRISKGRNVVRAIILSDIKFPFIHLLKVV